MTTMADSIIFSPRLSTHPVISVLLLHRVGVEEADDHARLRLPVLFVDFPEQQQGHKHFQVMEVVQFPDAEGFALQRGSARSKTEQCAVFPIHSMKLNVTLVVFQCCDKSLHHFDLPINQGLTLLD